MFCVRIVVAVIYRTWENTNTTFSYSLGSTLLFIEKATIDPLNLWVIMVILYVVLCWIGLNAWLSHEHWTLTRVCVGYESIVLADWSKANSNTSSRWSTMSYRASSASLLTYAVAQWAMFQASRYDYLSTSPTWLELGWLDCCPAGSRAGLTLSTTSSTTFLTPTIGLGMTVIFTAKIRN